MQPYKIDLEDVELTFITTISYESGFIEGKIEINELQYIDDLESKVYLGYALFKVINLYSYSKFELFEVFDSEGSTMSLYNLMTEQYDVFEDISEGFIDGKVFILSHLDISTKYRNVGIGSKVLKDIETYCRNHGTTIILLQPAPPHEDDTVKRLDKIKRLVDFYERSGYKIIASDGSEKAMIKDLAFL